MRISRDDYYLEMAATAAKRGTCLRRNYGAVIVKNDEIVSTGYTGSPRGATNCCGVGDCYRTKLGYASGGGYGLCLSVHAEQNAIISASRADCIGAAIYVAGFDAVTGEPVNGEPCYLCKRFILNAGIDSVVFKNSGGELTVVHPKSWIVGNSDVLRDPIELANVSRPQQ